MSDLISRQNAIDAWDKLSKRGRTEFDQVLMTLPSAEPKTGKWIMKHDGVIFKRAWGVCSCCGNTLDFDGLNAGRGNANFCPNCGARMLKEDGEA